MACRLCGSAECTCIAVDGRREFLRCAVCGLVFVEPRYHLSPRDELARYKFHDNSADGKGYRAWVNQFREELRRAPIARPSVLDFGSGPSRMLESILRGEGLRAASWDPLYGIGDCSPDCTYDIVAACEVLEHLRDLPTELRRIGRFAGSAGYVVVSTELYTDDTDFGVWWYARDPTHINFFSAETMQAVAHILGRKVLGAIAGRVTVFGPARV